jgi:6-pyruvoyltetrahydropterin/6-carboxytetrahydropterin synthase
MGGKYQVRIELTFASGHRLLEHNGKCVFPHGHTYRAEIWVASESLNELGFVVDFTELKEKVNGWIEEQWDHAFLLNSEDAELLNALRAVSGSRIFVFPGENPSAEVMARELYRRARDLCGIEPLKVRVWESLTQYAEFHETRPELDEGLTSDG